MNLYVTRAFLLTICFMGACAFAEPRHFVVNMDVKSEVGYCTTLLKTILEASKAPDEVIDFTYSDQRFSQARWLAEIQRDKSGNRIMWTTTTKEREHVLRPIRVPIFKGLFGTRVLIIRKEDKEKFSKITNQKELSALTAGQGVNWPDTQVLRDNNLPVREGTSSDALYQMLKAKRIDYFPRGIFELHMEANIIKDLDLMIEDTLLISYPMPMYFFVNKENEEFANRIEKGWEIIIKNGQFDKLFFSYLPVVAAVHELKKHKRHVIRLTNHLMSAETPIDNKKYWFDVSPYEE